MNNPRVAFRLTVSSLMLESFAFLILRVKGQEYSFHALFYLDFLFFLFFFEGSMTIAHFFPRCKNSKRTTFDLSKQIFTVQLYFVLKWDEIHKEKYLLGGTFLFVTYIQELIY